MVVRPRLEVKTDLQIDLEDFNSKAIRLEFIEHLDQKGSQKLLDFNYWLLEVV